MFERSCAGGFIMKKVLAIFVLVSFGALGAAALAAGSGAFGGTTGSIQNHNVVLATGSGSFGTGG
jgi:hypothetical protein